MGLRIWDEQPISAVKPCVFHKEILPELWEWQGIVENIQLLILTVVGATGKIVPDLLVIPWPGTCPLPFNPQLTLQPCATHRKNNCVLQLRKLNGHVKGLAGLWDHQKEKQGGEGSHLWAEQGPAAAAAQLPFSAVLYPTCINQEKSFNPSHLFSCKVGYWYIPALHG